MHFFALLACIAFTATGTSGQCVSNKSSTKSDQIKHFTSVYPSKLPATWSSAISMRVIMRAVPNLRTNPHPRAPHSAAMQRTSLRLAISSTTTPNCDRTQVLLHKDCSQAASLPKNHSRAEEPAIPQEELRASCWKNSLCCSSPLLIVKNKLIYYLILFKFNLTTGVKRGVTFKCRAIHRISSVSYDFVSRARQRLNVFTDNRHGNNLLDFLRLHNSLKAAAVVWNGTDFGYFERQENRVLDDRGSFHCRCCNYRGWFCTRSAVIQEDFVVCWLDDCRRSTSSRAWYHQCWLLKKLWIDAN